MEVLKNIQPTEVFKYFEEICNIPHGSGNEKGISDYCATFAKEHNLKFRQDELNNIVIFKDGTKGYENSEPVILQGHLDMVAVKTQDCCKDMDKEGLDLVCNNGYVYAKNTSLGGDDGIAIAYSLAILASDSIEHPPIEAVFTVDEEVGMLGASGIDLSDLQGKMMMNMDSEDEGIFLSGCAGGARVNCEFPVKKIKLKGVRGVITFENMLGGHSGVQIICQRANSNVLMGRIMHELSDELSFSIISISGGEKDNAIAKMGTLELLIEKEDKNEFLEILKRISKNIETEYRIADPDMKIKFLVEEDEGEYEVYDQSSVCRCYMAISQIPNGVIKMSDDIKGLVQTSLNLGIIKEKDDSVLLSYAVRSNAASEKKWLIDKMCSLTELLGGSSSVDGEYPAWEYRPQSRLRDIMTLIYEKQYGSSPKIETIHAGVECGLLAEKIKDLDCVSFGPDIIDIHTTDEKLDIDSVERTWKLIIEVLKELR